MRLSTVTVCVIAASLAMSACGNADPPQAASTLPPPQTVEAPPVSPSAPAQPATTTTVAPSPPTTHAEPPAASRPTTTAIVEPEPDAPRFLALGDSYVIGQSVDEEERWPVQLARRLRAEGVSLASPEFIARTGWTTAALAEAMDRAAPEGPYGLVGLQIGVNNQFNGGDIDVFRAEFATLLERSIALAGGEPGRVLVLSIPNWGVTPFAPDGLRGKISYEIELFNAVVADEAAARGALFVDVTENSKKAGDDSSYLSFDELHPSGLMYAEWAELALSEVAPSLTGGSR